ncbi:uncharacterized protein LOC123557754 [Mercenaria mercenaria]|uniref:uncharacterized protein LOC123557754 n=1 Tax=Mercenaria mercenaria TaxID=6596 RepID=UPI00234F9087|nr:uncharacterized protein LOC123557754 [Mercenaria mercenaria]
MEERADHHNPENSTNRTRYVVNQKGTSHIQNNPGRYFFTPVPDYTYMAIVATCCCFTPFGIVALCLANSTNQLAARGDRQQAMKISYITVVFILLSFIFPLFLISLLIALCLVLEYA